jgi:uncharacterized membrane protein
MIARNTENTMSKDPTHDRSGRSRGAGVLAGRSNTHLRRAENFIKSRFLWHRLYRATSYAKSALWVIPFVAIVLVLAITPPLRALDGWLGWRIAGLGMSGAQGLYQTVITLTLSFMVFTFGSLLVAIQIAGGQLTPRIIATTLLRDNVVRYSVGLFVFTLVFAVSALNRLEERVQELIALLTAILGISSIAMFLFLIDYAARLLRPVTILGRVGDEGLKVIEFVYPKMASEDVDPDVPIDARLGEPVRYVRHRGSPEVVLAIDLETLIFEATRVRGVIEFIPQVGDFIAFDEPLFALYAGAAKVDDRKLVASVAFGSERTLEQDPIFAFRMLVDIGLKALSPAINDPTTGVLAIDQVHRLLREVGKRELHGEGIADRDGNLRVIFCTPNWEDFIRISCNEIRNCGAGNVQIARRLRAMLDDLHASLPLHRRPSLDAERVCLDHMLDTLYSIPEDRALARMPDMQGLGGSSGTGRARRATSRS